MKPTLTKSIILFIALVIAGVCLVVFGQDAAGGAVRTVLPLLGAGMFTAGLTYLLVKLG
jgi:drug/metabolite transporter (DMT)-like permease